MELRQLECFIAVAEERHFGRAAGRLHLSQPPVSRQIQQLETELGVRLFDRKSNGVQLTDAGRVLLTHASRIMEETIQAADMVRSLGNGPSGQLRIGYRESLGVIVTVIDRLARLYPRIEPTLSFRQSGQMWDGISHHELDVAFPWVAANQSWDHNDFEHLQLFVDDTMVAVPAKSDLATLSEVSVSDFANYALIGFPRYNNPALYDAEAIALKKLGAATTVRFHAEDVISRLELVSAGLGIAIVGAIDSRLNRRPGVSFVRLSEPMPPYALALVWHRRNESPLVRVIVDLVRERKAAGDFDYKGA